MARYSRGRAGFLLVLALLLLVVGTISYVGWRQSVPYVSVTVATPRLLGQRTSLDLVAEAARGQVAFVEGRLTQGEQSAVVARHDGPLGPRAEIELTIEPATVGIREGAATLEIRAKDDFWRPLRFDDHPRATFPVTVDLTPPQLDVLAVTRYVAPGGAGVAVFRTDGDAGVVTRVGELTYPTFALGREGTRVGLFALPYDTAASTAVGAAAEDEAGNAAARGLPIEMLARRFRRDRIEITDSLLQVKVPELLPQRPTSEPLIDGFLVINRDQRRFAEAQKRGLATQTADRPLWEGAFLQPRNTKVFSNFAETRTYLYRGKKVDTQVHFGFDLASTRQAPVPAANHGRVIFAEPLTIYGNTVVLDHGLGLMTLYSHLSSIGVKVGDTVEKGQELGRTGTTGLAVGDHLHFEVLVHGVSVTPLEWWDEKWIRDRIDGPLRAGGLAGAPGF